MNLNNKLKGDAGEYFVAFELARRGINPAIMSRNSKGVDLLATDNGENVISIQVKTSSGTNNHKQWDVGSHSPSHSETFFYFFINMWDDPEKEIEYLIVPSQIVKEKVNWEKQRPQFAVNEEEYKMFLYNWDSVLKLFKME